MRTFLNTSLRDIWNNYRAEMLFFLILSACVIVGHYLSRFIPEALIDDAILPLQHGANVAICVLGACLLFLHSDGLRIRKASAYALVIWGLADAFLMIQDYLLQLPVLRIGSNELDAYILFFGNFLGWVLLIYPTETLRPGWLNWKRALLELLPLAAFVALDYWVPIDLRWIIALYPAVLIGMLVSHIRAYRLWCENNYSTMDHIDVQWIVRYLIMVLVMGLSYMYILLSDNPGRVVTQNALLFFLYCYAIEQILFRKDPWEGMMEESIKIKEENGELNGSDREKLEQWMSGEKPYRNPDFKLLDLRAVLPMNRTYLSQFINDTYGCSFYQFVNQYRIEEAKRLLRECPELKIEEIAIQCGFSSRSSFTQTFTKETGLSPREWSKQCYNS